MQHRLIVAVETTRAADAVIAARNIAWGGVGVGLLLLVGSGIAAYLLVRRVRSTVGAPVPNGDIEHGPGAEWRGAGGPQAIAHGQNQGVNGPVQAGQQGGNRAQWALLAALVMVLLLVGARVLMLTPAGSSEGAATTGTEVPVASETTTPAASSGPSARVSISPLPSAKASSPSEKRSSPAPAQPPVTTAPPSPTVLCVPPDCPAQATFRPDNDSLTVCDKKPDGYAGVAVYTRSDVTGQMKLWASGSAGTCESASLNMASGATITFKVCIGDQSENRINTCSAETTVRA